MSYAFDSYADPNKDHVTVVKIIRVVRRRKAPVVVEVIS